MIAPGPTTANTARNLKTLTIVNRDPTSPNPITVTRTIKGVTAVMTPGLSGQFVLPAGFCLQWTDENDWRLLDQFGAEVTVSMGVISPIAIEAAGSSVSVGTIVFSYSNNVSFGMNGSTVTASAVVGPGLINISAGTTSNLMSAVTFSNSNNVAFGLSGSVVTARAGAPAISLFSQDADFVTNFPIAQTALSIQKVSLAMNLTATQLAFIGALSGTYFS